MDVVRDFIGNQKQEVEVKKQELALKSKEVDNSHEYAQKELYQNTPTERRKDRWQNFWIGVFAVIIVTAFFIYLFESENGEFAKEIIKYLIGAILGGGVGYGMGTYKVKPKDEGTDT